MRIEGENRIDIESIVSYIANKYGIDQRKALKWFCIANQYNTVAESITNQLDYFIKENMLSK